MVVRCEQEDAGKNDLGVSLPCRPVSWVLWVVRPVPVDEVAFGLMVGYRLARDVGCLVLTAFW